MRRGGIAASQGELMITDLKINPAAQKRYYKKGYWTSQTLHDVWEEQVARYSERPYVKDELGCTLSYGEVDEKAARLASWLEETGVENGSVVTMQIPKWAEFCIAYVACLKCGAVMHPVPSNFNGDDLQYSMNLAESRVYIGPTFHHNTDYVAQFASIAHCVPTCQHALFIDKDVPLDAASAYRSLSSVLEAYEPITTPCPSSSDEVACILSTSGTTGRPKAVLLTHNNILFSERAYVSVLDLTCEDKVWMPSPLNHATGFFHGLIATMLVGASAVLELSFNAEAAIDLINREGCTWSHGATPFVYDIISAMQKTGKRVPSLRFYLCGGAPLPDSLVAQANHYGFLLCESYGSTESCPHVYVPLDACLEWGGKWSGIAYEGIEVRVVDEHHCEVARGVQGEECSRGPHQFVGYLHDKEQTDIALDDEGWFYSGDLCVMDEQGRIRINGRKKEIIIRGGENISTREIDERVAPYPEIGDHASIGMPDKRLGERICLFAVPRSKQRPTLTDMQQYLTSINVPKRLWPERIEFIDAIPHTQSGKVKRCALAEELRHRMQSQA